MIVRGPGRARTALRGVDRGGRRRRPAAGAGPEGALAADLLERGVRFVPALTCQALGRSKCAQALVFRGWMAPHTRVVARRADLMAGAAATMPGTRSARSSPSRKGCTAGTASAAGRASRRSTTRWRSTQAAYPFVLQPFLEGIGDVRVIVVGDFVEAYLRENLYNFRANIAAGGASRPLRMDPAAEALCRAVMERGRFPYAHVDLHLTAAGECLLAEIALEGGIAAARIGARSWTPRNAARLEALARAAAENPLPHPF